MLMYVSHKAENQPINIERIKKILKQLQFKDLQNAYICPLTAFIHLWGTDIPYQEELDLRLDLLSVCDVLLVASEVTETVKKEIEFANLVGMEVKFLNEEN